MPVDQDTAALADQLVVLRDAKARAIARDAVALHTDSEDHRRPRGLVTAVFHFDSGVLAQPLDASASLPCGVVLPFPCVLNAWRIAIPAEGQAGGAEFDVKLVPPGVTMASAASICTGAAPTLSSGREAAGDCLNVWPTTSLEGGSYLYARLISATSVDVVELHLEARRT
jgi:hypothetical protein